MATNKLSSTSYLVIGSGRVARHIGHYFHLLNLKHKSWDRSQDPHALKKLIHESSHVLLAISDNAIEGFFRLHLAGLEKTVVHFSGAHNFDVMIAAHPLMTFGPDLYDLEFYKKIHFTMTGASLNEALPGLTNPSSVLPAEQKALYHAYCVLGGNFTTLLLAKMLEGFAEMKIPSEAAKLYIEKVVGNTFAEPGKALTGPLVRKDIETVNANLQALDSDSTAEIYKAFLKTYWPEYPRK
ncbi:Rossmann-like and DUF2520 domain-containing protein [Bdellovibrio svalbardensis]|uniref:DUF2520 domain-containing protein n=1 Tax=Bdellovibrio svalbardensis TaxID=2972972 RepID=A0ABT6DEI9_9BACT|nr:Rossmann-like and DUF2520 domain-containing protein [Bdellovibrio svalbardensis]MDG0815232.1 DUF2520 domain-containing protein [Bdellovibrio svalbardensis]